MIAILLALWLSIGDSAAAQDITATRPNAGGDPDEVTVFVGVLDIVNIDNKAQVFNVDLYAQIRWVDLRLASDADDVGEFRTFSLDEIWTPRLVILNDRGLDRLLPDVVTVDRQGNVVMRQRLAGPLAVDLDLREFPFDTQQLTVEVVSYQYAPEELVFSDESAMIGEVDGLSGGGWTYAAVEPEMSIYRLSGTGPGSARLTFIVSAERQASFYAITLALPMTLILFLAWMVHWLPPDLVPARMGMASATVFSLIALGVSFRLTMPDITYLTDADRFVLFSTLLLIVSLAVTVASIRMVSRDSLEAALSLTRRARWTFPVVYIGIFLILIA